MFTHDTKPDKTILIYSKHQLTLELSPLSEFRSLSEFWRPNSYTDSPVGSFWVNADMDLTLTSRPTSGTRQFVSIGSFASVWPWWSANSFLSKSLETFQFFGLFFERHNDFCIFERTFEWFDIPSRYPSRLQSENKIFRSTRCLQNYQKSTKYNRYFFYLVPT